MMTFAQGWKAEKLKGWCLELLVPQPRYTFLHIYIFEAYWKCVKSTLP